MDREQAAAEEDGRPVGDLLDLGQDVGGHQDGVGTGEGTDQRAHLDDLLRVEPVGGLVEDEHARLIEEGLSDGDALAESLRQLADGLIADGAEIELLTHARDGGTRRVALEPFDGSHEREKFAYPHAVVERRVLGNVADLSPGRYRAVHRVEAGDARPARRRPQIAAEDPENRRLARAVGPEQPHDLAGIYFERDAVDSQAWSVPLGEPVGDDHRSHGSSGERQRQPGPGAQRRSGRFTSR